MARRAVETRGKLAVGAVLTGVVTAVKDFGAFVDLGGIEGMLPASELTHTRGTRPADVLAVGQRLTVQITRIEKRDDERRPEQVSLSLKALEADPWDDAVAALQAGALVRGTVKRTEPFGAFVEVAPGVEGLLRPGWTAAMNLSWGLSWIAVRIAHSLANSTSGRPSTSSTDVVDPGRSNLSRFTGSPSTQRAWT